MPVLPPAGSGGDDEYVSPLAGKIKEDKKSNKDKILGSAWVKKPLGAVATVLTPFDRAHQTVLGGINAVQNETPGDLNFWEGAYAGMYGLDRYEEDVAVTGRRFEGRGAGTARFGLSLLTDPTTYLTLGTGSAAKQGVKAFGDVAATQVAKKGGSEVLQQEARKAAMDQVRKQGVKSFDDATQAEVRSLLKQTAVDAGVNPRRTLGQIARGQAKGTLDDGATRYADNVFTQTAIKGRGGLTLKAPGINKSLTVVSDAQLDNLAAKSLSVGGRDVSLDIAKATLANSRPAQAAARAIKPGAALTQRFGSKLGNTIHDLSRGRSEEVSSLVDDADRQLRAAQKQLDLTDADYKIINAALESGDEGLESLRNTRPELMPVAEPLFQLKNQGDTILDEALRNGDIAGGTPRAKQEARAGDLQAKRKQIAADTKYKRGEVINEGTTAKRAIDKTSKTRQADAVGKQGVRKEKISAEAAARQEALNAKLGAGKEALKGKVAKQGERLAKTRKTTKAQVKKAKAETAKVESELAEKVAKNADDAATDASKLADFKKKLRDADNKKIAAAKKRGKPLSPEAVAALRTKTKERIKEATASAKKRQATRAGQVERLSDRLGKKQAKVTAASEKSDAVIAAAKERKAAIAKTGSMRLGQVRKTTNAQIRGRTAKETAKANERAKNALKAAKGTAQKNTRLVNERTAKKLDTVSERSVRASERVGERLAKITGDLDAPRQRTRVLTKQGEKVVRSRSNAEDVAEILGVSADDVLGSPHQLAQKVGKGRPVSEVNKEISQKLHAANLLKKGEQFFDENALRTSLADAKDIADQVATAKQVRSIKDLIDPKTGAPLMMRAGDDVPPGYVEVNVGPLGTYHVPPQLRDELMHITNVIVNDPSLSGFVRTMNSWTRFWKVSATILPVGGAFTARNARSNLFLNYLAGVSNPQHYIDAGKIQKTLARVEKKFTKEVAYGDYMKAVERELDDPRLFRAYKEARETGAITSSYEFQDLGVDLSGVGPVRKGLGHIKNVPRKATEFGSTANGIVETNSRLAHFIAKRDELGDPIAAAASVKKYLFDYANLTPFERQLKTTVYPFYTFMRKNSPLMIETLITNPGKFQAREHFLDMFGVRTDENTKGVPDYLRGERKLNESISTMLGGKGAEFIIKDDSTLTAGLEPFEPLAAGIGALPVVGRAVPDGFKAQDSKDLARKTLKPFSGPQVEAAKYVVEKATGTSLFTGGRLDAKNPYDHAARAITPAYGRASGIVAPIFKKDGQKKAALINAVTGLRATRITKAQRAQLDAIEAEITKTRPRSTGDTKLAAPPKGT